MNELTCNFFAILTDGQLRKINLTQDITTEVRRAFIDHAGDLSDNGLDQIEFEGNYVLDKGEIFFVSMELDPAISEAVRDAFGIQELNLGVDMIKTLFWFEDNVYYFQNFDSRKLLSNKKVLCYSNNTYHKLTNDAFILDNHVDGIYRDDKFYFYSYRNGNRIFSLLDFYKEATNEDLSTFSAHPIIEVDSAWLQANADTIIRKQIALISNAGILDTVHSEKIYRKARRLFGLVLDVHDGKINLPCDKKACKEILNFLNEQYYVGPVSGRKYITNSKRRIDN